VGEAARRLAKLCFAHFAFVEQTALPAFAALQTLSLGDECADTAEVLALIGDFSRSHGELLKQQESMNRAIDALWEAAYEEGNREVVSFTRSLKGHKRMEEQVLFPVLLLLGKCLQEKLAVGVEPCYSARKGLFPTLPLRKP
jgi:hypothetical protein